MTNSDNANQLVMNKMNFILWNWLKKEKPSSNELACQQTISHNENFQCKEEVEEKKSVAMW